jgi:DNA invertase Pin-like site-specific DNA recombinase
MVKRTQIDARTIAYARISTDNDLALDRQQDAMRSLAAARGWPEPEWIVETISAAKGPRPGWEQTVAAVRGGGIHAVIVWNLDRAWRSLTEAEAFIAACEQHDTQIAVVQAGDIDPGTAAGRLVLRLMASTARHEIEVRRERQEAESIQRARDGRPKAGGPRGWGYTREMEMVPDEAEVVREIAGRVLAGERIGSLARELTDRGIRTPTGRVWDAAALRRSMLRPSLAGHSEHRGQIVGRGRWQPILEPAQHEALRVALRSSGKRWGRQSPLTGLVWCGRCGASMAQTTVAGRRVLRCYNTPTRPGCHLQVNAEITESLVAAAARVALADARLEPEPQTPTGGPSLADLAARREQAAQAFALGEITASEWATVRQVIDQQQAAAEATLARAAGATADPTPLLTEATWEAANTDQRRAILATLIERIEVGPATRRGPATEAEVWARLTIQWKA